ESADGSLSETVRITINGWNDPASISGDSTGELFVAGYAAGPLNFAPIVSGQLQVSDADAGESIFGSIAYISAYGTFTYTPAGSWIFDLDEQNQDVIDLGSNETLTETFTLTSLDGTASEDVVITIHRVILVELEPFAATTTPDTGTLTGTPESDHFVYHLGDGPVTITDFEPGPQNQGQIIDQIELAGFGDFGTLDTDGNQLLDQMDIGINGDATSITLDLGNGDTLTVANVTTLMEDDLLFS
ncbi:MAG: VCBS domain-containing protein, partial [Methyloceanibacter sp.]